MCYNSLSLHKFLGLTTDLAMRRAFALPAALSLAAATVAALGGCSSDKIIDELPPAMGLPTGTPARPATPYTYPAVHDMPPPRATEPLSAEEQLKMEDDLIQLRKRQEGAQADTEDDKSDDNKKPAKSAKKKPAAGQSGASTGANPNP
jgi:hypothetical protein